MKKLSLLLSFTLIFSLLAPGAALADTNKSSDLGYIVKLREVPENSARLLENSQLDARWEDGGLYHAESLADIKKLGSLVEYYEPETQATLFTLPNDTYAPQQWSIPDLGIEAAWDKNYEGPGVRVAVIDSGVNSMHEDFETTHFEKGTNVVDNSHDVNDESGHGTVVSGIIAATRNNKLGIAGFCNDVTIIPLKCFTKGATTDSSYVIEAMYEAIDTYDCDVINLSLGMSKDLKSMRDAVDYAVSKGVIVVSAVGNDGKTELNYPAAYSNVVGVGATDKNGKLAAFSQRNSSVFVTAPGVDIYGLGYESSSSYIVGNGTSYATPYVAVAAIILKQADPTADVHDFMELLKATSIDRGAVGYDHEYGYGSLNIKNFITAMEAGLALPPETKFTDIAGHWAESYINLCLDKKLFNGVSDTLFAPETTMTRGMFIAVLSRLSGENISGYQNTFTDVKNDAYYATACAWGATKGIVSGLGNGIFNPEGLVSRQEMATFLYRYGTIYSGAKPGDVASLTRFSDGASTASWAKAPAAWAVENGIINGLGNGKLAPLASAKRCEVATIVTNFVNRAA